MSQKDKVRSWENYIIDALSTCYTVQVPEVTALSQIGLRKEEAESIALKNNLTLSFLEHRVNDFPGLFQFERKEKKSETINN